MSQRRWLAILLIGVITAVGLGACASAPPISSVPGHPGMHTQTVTSGDSVYSVYWRDTPSATRGGVMLVHGGGWTGGDRDRFTEPAIQLADEGYVAATVDYRLATATSNAWPAQQQDVLSAWRALRNNASTYHLNVRYLALAGESAGGHIALAAAEAMLPTERPAALVSWSGPTDLVAWMTHPQPACLGSECYYYNQLTAIIPEYLLHCSYAACPTRYRAASPALNVSSALPPTLQTFFARDIVPLSQGQIMNAALLSRGTSAQLTVYPDFGHGATWTPQVWNESLAFLRHYMAPPSMAPSQRTQPLPEVPVRRLPLGVTA